MIKLILTGKKEDRDSQFWHELSKNGDPRKSGKDRRQTVPNIGAQFKSMGRTLGRTFSRARHQSKDAQERSSRKKLVWILLFVLVLLVSLIALVSIILTNLDNM
jgi:hypothetical protein